MFTNKIDIDLDKVLESMARNGFGIMDLARESGITHRTLKRFFDNKGGSSKICGKIAEALEVDITEIKKDDAA